MELEEVCKELNEARAEIRKLKAEYQIKTELSNSLKKVHNDKLLEFEETQQQIERQAQELDAKREHSSELRHMLKDLKSSLHEKELSLRHLSSTNEKLRADCREKLHKLEVENRELVLGLDEVVRKSKELEQKLSRSNEENVRLRNLLLVSENRFLEAEQKVQAPKKLRQGDDLLLKLEKGNRDIQDQLKWKAEQFQHLEEAHKRLQERLRSREEEWERDKAIMFQEISSLQTNLYSQTRISDSLQNQLEMYNQTLARQESKRKFLGNQVSEFELHCNNERHKEKSRMESLTAQRDEEIAGPRNLPINKEAFFKELEFGVAHLGKENQELELRKSQIRNAGTASLLTELRKKLKGLEQALSNCCPNFTARECEWSSQMEKMKDDITSCKSELKGKKKQIEELYLELEDLHSAVDVLNEEFSTLPMVLKSEFSETYCKLLNAKAEVEQCSKGKEDKISFLTEQLQMKNDALNRSQLHLGQEHEKVTTLLTSVESLNSKDQRLIVLVEELERHKKMLQEFFECQFHLKERVLKMENAVKSDRKEIYDTLEEAEFELAEIIREGHQLVVEWQKRNSTVESPKVFIGENKDLCKQIETSFVQSETEQTLKQEKECCISIVKDQDKNIDNLKVSQEPAIMETKVADALIADKENLLCMLEEKDSYIDTLHKDISWSMEDSIIREAVVEVSAKSDAEKAFQKEQGKLLNEKEQSIRDLQVLVMSVKKDLTNAVASHFSEITKMQAEINAIGEALNNDEHQRKLEVEEKNNVITGLQKEVSGLCQRLSSLEQSFHHAKQVSEQVQAVVEAKKAETERLMNQFQNERRSMKALVEELEIDKGVLIQEIMKLSSERENTLVLIEEFYDLLSDISVQDAKLMKFLERKLRSWEEESEPLIDIKVSDEPRDSDKRNCNRSFSLPIRKPEMDADERLALKELNI